MDTQAHCMRLNQITTESLNPGQTPNQFRNYLALLGPLHIEQVLLVMHGQLIDGSGLLKLMKQHQFTTIGLSAVVDVSSIKRARYAIQVILAALYLKLVDVTNEIKCDKEILPLAWLEDQAGKNEM